MENKICNKCKIEQPLSNFIKDKNIKCGLKCICKNCSKNYQDNYRKNNPHKRKESNSKWCENNPEKYKESKEKAIKKFIPTEIKENRKEAKHIYDIKYRKTNSDKIKEQQRTWCEHNKKN